MRLRQQSAGGALLEKLAGGPSFACRYSPQLRVPHPLRFSKGGNLKCLRFFSSAFLIQGLVNLLRKGGTRYSCITFSCLSSSLFSSELSLCSSALRLAKSLCHLCPHNGYQMRRTA